MFYVERSVRYMFPERLFNYVGYYYLHLRNGVWPKMLNLKKPFSFNEKIIWLKLNHKVPNATELCDKYRVRSFVKDKIGEKHLVPLIDCFDNVDQVHIDKLPDSFVLKPNHGSGYVIVVPSKKKLKTRDIIAIKKRLREWMETDYYKWGKSYEYKGIRRRILCEIYLESSTEKPLLDYKVHCFGGEPQLIQVDFDRFSRHTRKFYDLNWNVTPFSTLYPLSNKDVSKPDRLDQMLIYARKLSEGLIYSRIDFYIYNGQIYFGEITLHHGGGFEPFYPREYDYIIGRKIKLPF